MEWARRCLSHRAHRELRDSLFDFSEDSVISPGTARQGRCVAREALAHAFIHSPILKAKKQERQMDYIEGWASLLGSSSLCKEILENVS